MKIAGIQKNSFVDYPDKLSAVVFTLGCNMNCFYCHNREIIREKDQDIYNPDSFLEFLEKRKGFLEGVVVTGGEPTLQPDLKEYIESIKNMGYYVKLDTNGTNPQIVEDILKEQLIDYIAMDVKGPISKYEEICGVSNIVDSILQSIDLLINSSIKYEFRTTLIPQITLNDMYEITECIKGARKYVIQQYRIPIPENSSSFNDPRLKIKPLENQKIREYGEAVRGYFKEFQIRGI